MSGRTSLTVYPGSGMAENAFINVKNRSFSISADVQIPSSSASGVILAQGGRFGGWSLWLRDGRPRFTYNWLGIERYDIVATGLASSGDRNIRFEFVYDGGKPGSGGLGRISIDGAYVAEGRVARTQPFLFGGESADVGEDLATPVSGEYQVPASFSGTIQRVTIDVQPIAVADRSAVDESARNGLQRLAAVE
jgi:arylsulfatase